MHDDLGGTEGLALIPVLETERLILRPLELADATQVQRIFPVWGVVRLLANSVPWPYPEDGALTYYRDVALPAIERGEEWHWSLRPKTAPEELIGMVALFRKTRKSRGFWVGVPWQGQGLMTEASARVTRYWFEELEMPVLRVRKAVENVASRRISEREGMRVVAVEEGNYVSGRLPTEVWEITAEEWRRRLGSG